MKPSSGIKKQISGASPQDVQLRALEREAKAQRDLLESYLARYREATARENIDSAPAEARIISRATVSNVPAFPKKLPILLVATLAALFLSAAFVHLVRDPAAGRADSACGRFATEALKDVEPAWRQDSRRRSRRRPGGHCLDCSNARTRSVPVVRAPKRHPGSRNSGRLQRRGRTGSRHSPMRSARWGEAGRSIVVFGAERNVGTTYTALALARALSAKGGRVVLADLALNAPNLSIMSVDPQAPGFAELARGTASFGDIITRDKFSRAAAGFDRPGDGRCSRYLCVAASDHHA